MVRRVLLTVAFLGVIETTGRRPMVMRWIPCLLGALALVLMPGALFPMQA